MPKPNYSAQHDPRAARMPLRTSHGPASESAEAPHQDAQALEAEVQRLRTELARSRPRKSGTAASSPDAQTMVWLAIAICGGCLVFAIVALMRHG